VSEKSKFGFSIITQTLINVVFPPTVVKRKVKRHLHCKKHN